MIPNGRPKSWPKDLCVRFDFTTEGRVELVGRILFPLGAGLWLQSTRETGGVADCSWLPMKQTCFWNIRGLSRHMEQIPFGNPTSPRKTTNFVRYINRLQTGFLHSIPVVPHKTWRKFQNRRPIGEVGCCESRMAEAIHWLTERWLELCLLEWLQWLQWSPHPQLLDVVRCTAAVVAVVA